MFFKRMKAKTKAIEAEKAKFKKDIRQDIERQKAVNKVLANGVWLSVYHASGGK